jgi:hypothetical protein
VKKTGANVKMRFIDKLIPSNKGGGMAGDSNGERNLSKYSVSIHNGD